MLCVPSPYEEPKGLYVLEALAAGVPVVSPDHGAFPELRADTGGLALFRAGDVEHLTDVLDGLLMDAGRRRALGQQGRSAVIERRSAKHAAEAVMAVYRELIGAYVKRLLLRRHHANDPSALLRRRNLDLGDFLELFQHICHHASAFFHMGNLSTTKHDRDLHFVFVLEEVHGLLHLEVDVVLPGFGAQTKFLRLRVVNVALGVLLLLLILVFAEVHDSANGRLFVRSNLDEIEAVFARHGQRFFSW